MNIDNIKEIFDLLTPDYLAGLFDGEGSISIHKFKAGYRIGVNITQSNLFFITMLSLKFGGSVCQGTGSSITRKKVYQVQWSGTSGKKLLSYIKDRLILKREEVRIALEFMTTIGDKGRTVPDHDLDKREQLFREIGEVRNSTNPGIAQVKVV